MDFLEADNERKLDTKHLEINIKEDEANMGKERVELWCRPDSLGQSIGNSGVDTFIHFVCEGKGGRESSHGCGSRGCMPGHTCGDQRTALWSSFSPSTFMCILGVKLKSPGLQGKCLYPVSHLACPDCFEAIKKTLREPRVRKNKSVFGEVFWRAHPS